MRSDFYFNLYIYINMKLAVIAIGRRENRYAREWVGHYLDLGFDHIYIADNNYKGEERFESVLGDYVSSGRVSIHDYRDQDAVQGRAYTELYARYGDGYDWVGFFDFDEFLELRRTTVRKWLKTFESTDADCVMVNWKCYGDCGLLYDDGRRLSERFTKPIKKDKCIQYAFPENEQVKSIVRGHLKNVAFWKSPHFPDAPRHCYTAAGQPCRPSSHQELDWSVGWIRHYTTKTISEWMQNKWSKGTGFTPHENFERKYGDRLFLYNERTPEKMAYVGAFERARKDKVTVCIVHYNTPRMTECCVRSLQRSSPGVKVIIFDNSDKAPFVPMDGVEVIDNTHGQIIDFNMLLAAYPTKVDVGNGWASAKHCFTVQWLINKRRNPFILMDSDVLVRQDITSFWDKTQTFVGQVKPHTSKWGITVDRVLPFLCFINVPLVKVNNLSYYNYPKMWALTPRKPDIAYDTGCWFLEEVHRARLPYHHVSLEPFIYHFGHGSWKEKSPDEWLQEHKDLWT